MLVSVAACDDTEFGHAAHAPSASDGGSDGVSADDTGSWQPPEAQLDEYGPQWTAEEVAQEAGAFFDADHRPWALTIMELYLALMAEGDEDCPGHAEIILAPLEGCSASTGMTYVGIGHMVTQETEDEAGELSSWSRYTAIADFQMYTPSGEEFIGAGSLRHGWSRGSDGRLSAEMQVRGSYRWTGAGPEDPWFETGVGSSLYVAASSGDPMGRESLRFVGSVDTRGKAVYFDDFEVDLGDCGGHPVGGRILLRQDDGSWVAMAFEEDVCSPCGEVTWNREESLGEACLDVNFQEWLVWMTSEPA